MPKLLESTYDVLLFIFNNFCIKRIVSFRTGLHQQAYMHILSANDWCPPQPLYIEQAQLYWQKGCQEDAFTTLNRCFSNCFQPAQYYKQLPSENCNEERRYCAKVCI